MSRAQNVWIHQQLHPDDVLIAGNAKRHRPLWVQQAEGITAWIEKHGIDEHKLMERELKQFKTEQNETDND